MADDSARLMAILDSALDAIVTMDAEGRITGWNAQASATFGWPFDAVVGREMADVIIPFRYRDAHRDGLARFLVSGEGPILRRRIEITGLRQDGSEIPVELTVTPFRLDQGWQFSAFLRDISASKQAADSARAANERLELVARATNDAVWDWDLGTGQVWRNEAYTTLFGYRVHTGLGMDSWDDRVHPDDRDRVDSGLRLALDEGMDSWTDEYQFLCADGTHREVLDRAHILRNADGAATRVIGAMMDVTPRRRAERLQRESEAQTRLIFESSPEAMYVYDVDTLHFLTANDAAIRRYGYSLEELRGLTLHDIRPEAQQSRLKSMLPEQGDSAAYFDVQHRTRDGTLLDMEIVTNPLEYAGRQARFVLARDVTERKRLEGQLRQAQKLEAVGQLAGGIAHDFNNLLTAITGHGGLLLDSLPEGSSDRQDVEQILRASDRAASLTQQLVAFSRKQVLQPRVIDLNGVVSNTERLLRRVIDANISILSRLAPDLGPVVADPVQLEQVIVNLVVNARDAMPKGGELHIGTRNLEGDEWRAGEWSIIPAGRYVELTIRDSGIGMDEATRARVFEPFFTTKEAGKGTGLGLSSAYGIVKQSNGFLWVRSAPGQGSTFTMHIPRSDRPVDNVMLEHSARVPRGVETVLLIDDDASVRYVARRALEGHGYQVLEAAEPSVAITLAATNPSIQLLLTDMMMPGLTGRELADQMVALYPGLRVLFMSGYLDQSTLLETGAPFLQKPFTPEALARKVREVLDSQPGA
ncbi:MAG: PAS domain S-box protein [Gammaproteobacteria bacterium]